MISYKRRKLANLFIQVGELNSKIGKLMLEDEDAQKPQTTRRGRERVPLTLRAVNLINRRGKEGVTLSGMSALLASSGDPVHSTRITASERRAALQTLISAREVVAVETREAAKNGRRSGTIRTTLYSAEFAPKQLARNQFIVNLLN